MKRIVFCWEMGGNYGHIAGFLPLYQELRRRGVDVWLIVREKKFVHLLGAEALSKTAQAPSPKFRPEPRNIHTYADLLVQIGYTNQPVLTRYLLEWCELIASVKPDLIISDHAPTAQLAGRALNISVTSLGTGFILPPVESVFPPFFSELGASAGRVEPQILSVVNSVLRFFKAEPYTHIGELFTATQQMLCSFEEQDHYFNRPPGLAFKGALFSDQLGKHFNWPKQADYCSFIYLTPKVRQLEQVVKFAAELPGFKLFHIPGASDTLIHNLEQGTDAQVVSEPVLMASVFEHADMVIHQGGMGVSAQCLLAGVAQVMIPTQTEQRMLARRMLMQNLAAAADHHKPDMDYKNLFNLTLTNSVLREKLHRIKTKYANFSQAQQVSNLVDEMSSFALLK